MFHIKERRHTRKMATTAIESRRTLADTLLPWKSLAFQLILVFASSLLVALLAQVAIPLPFTPVPLTGQTYGVLLVGAALGSKRGAASLLLYILEGGLGLPFLAAGKSGWPAGPTGGYLIGFVAAAFAVGWLAERGWDRRFGNAVLAMLIGEALIYVFGVPWLAAFVGINDSISLGLLPFIPGDAVKLLIAAATLPIAWRLLGKKNAGKTDRR